MVSRSVVGKSVNSKAVVSRSVVAGTLVSSKAVQVGSKLKISASVCSSLVVEKEFGLESDALHSKESHLVDKTGITKVGKPNSIGINFCRGCCNDVGLGR